MIIISIVACAVTYFYFLKFGEGEIIQNVLIGWNGDISTYKEYPIKGYEMMSLVFFVLYITAGLGFWTLSALE